MQYNQVAGKNVQRIEAISDGIFAIAMTLLVLDLKVPVGEAIHTESDLVAAFCSLTPRLISYLLGFMTLGIFWTGHSTQFNFIEKSDRNLTWLSIFFLMFVSLLPFSTAFLSEHIQFRVSIGLYWLNILLPGVLLLVHWNYAYKHGFISVDGTGKAEVHQAIRRRIFLAQLMYAGGALLCFISNYLSIALIVLIQLNYALGLVSGVKPAKKRR